MTSASFERATDDLQAAVGGDAIIAVRFAVQADGRLLIEIDARVEDAQLLEVAAHAMLGDAIRHLDPACDGCRQNSANLTQARDLILPPGSDQRAVH